LNGNNKPLPTNMIKVLLIILLFPALLMSQNVVSHVTIEKDKTITPEFEYKIYYLKIFPGYKDKNYKFELMKQDSVWKEIIYSNPEINVELIVHKKDYPVPGTTYVEWDYSTEIKSNDIWTDSMIEIGDCSNSKSLNCLIRLPNKVTYYINIYSDGKLIFNKKLDD
jgi:hypothetical protein